MKLPDKIKGRNRIRDAAIVLEFKRTRPTYDILAKKFNLTEMRISQILRTNHAFIPIDKEWEKEKRITKLERWLDDPKNKDTRKDPVDILEQLRKEIEGDISSKELALVDNSVRILVINKGSDGTELRNREGRQDSQRVDLVAQAVSRFSESS